MIRSRGVVAVLAAAAAALGMGACHARATVTIGNKTIDRITVEQQAAVQLQQGAGAAKPPTIDCPDDLDAKVGATIDCTLSTDTSSAEYAVHIVVTSIHGDDAVFNVKVANSPN